MRGLVHGGIAIAVSSQRLFQLVFLIPETESALNVTLETVHLPSSDKQSHHHFIISKSLPIADTITFHVHGFVHGSIPISESSQRLFQPVFLITETESTLKYTLENVHL